MLPPSPAPSVRLAQETAAWKAAEQWAATLETQLEAARRDLGVAREQIGQLTARLSDAKSKIGTLA